MNKNYFTGFSTIFDNDELTAVFEDFIDSLPHGSGIDCDWGAHMPDNGRYVYFTNSYHCMNEYGFYEGWQDFTIMVNGHDFIRVIQSIRSARAYAYEPAKETMKERAYHLLKLIADEFSILFNNGHYLADKHMLRDYLEDTFRYAFSESVYNDLID